MKICNSSSFPFIIRNSIYACMITCNENTICNAYFTNQWKLLTFDLDGRFKEYLNSSNIKHLKMTLKQLFLQTFIEENP